MSEALAALDAAELSTLNRLEDRIRAGLSTFVEVGEALAQIRDSRLYRGTHGTFESYCRDQWSITDRRARQLMTAAEIGTIVPKISTESQARELAKVAPEKREEVMKSAIEQTGGKVTAAAIRKAAVQQMQPEVKVVPFSPGITVDLEQRKIESVPILKQAAGLARTIDPEQPGVIETIEWFMEILGDLYAKAKMAERKRKTS